MIFSSGCGNQKIEDSASKVNENEHYSLEQIITEIEEQGISEIKIFKSEGHGSVGRTLIKKLPDSNEHSLVLHSIKTASQKLGILDTSTPNYDFVFHLKNNDLFSFQYWLENTEEMMGMFVNMSDTGTGYILSRISSEALLELVE